MTQRYYDTAILGATFLGLGAALNLENVVVIERGGLLGSEYVASYKVCEPKNINPKTKSGREFLCDLKERGLISETGEIYPAPTVYVLSSFLKEKNIDILLMTETINIERKEGLFYITVYHTKGYEVIIAKRILDTTTLGIWYNNLEETEISKSLNAIIYNPEKKSIDGLSYNSMNQFYTYSLPVNLDTCRYDAIEMLCDKEEFRLNGMHISSIASEFAYKLEPRCVIHEENYIWNPSTAYANLVEAFERGAQMAEEV